jgi:hypothetical protein
MSVIFGLLLLIVIFASGAVFWGWYAIPKDRVPPHLQELDLKRLETEDRLRQTSYQLLAGGALVLTFCLTVYQAASSYNQWSSDYALRNRQTEVSHLSEVLKALSSETNPAARIAGYFSVRQLVLQYPTQEGRLSAALLTYSIRSVANTKDTFAKAALSKECGGGDGAPPDREEPYPDVQIAMNVLGDPAIADSLRPVHFDGNKCTWDANSSSLTNVDLSHLALNNLDLGGTNFDLFGYVAVQISQRKPKTRFGARDEFWGSHFQRPGYARFSQDNAGSTTSVRRREPRKMALPRRSCV